VVLTPHDDWAFALGCYGFHSPVATGDCNQVAILQQGNGNLERLCIEFARSKWARERPGFLSPAPTLLPLYCYPSKLLKKAATWNKTRKCTQRERETGSGVNQSLSPLQRLARNSQL
jgi:hypothetical protein